MISPVPVAPKMLSVPPKLAAWLLVRRLSALRVSVPSEPIASDPTVCGPGRNVQQTAVDRNGRIT